MEDRNKNNRIYVSWRISFMFKKKSRMITGAAVFVLSTGLLVSCGQKETAGTEAKQSVAEMVTEEVGVKALEENRVKSGHEKY